MNLLMIEGEKSKLEGEYCLFSCYYLPSQSDSPHKVKEGFELYRVFENKMVPVMKANLSEWDHFYSMEEVSNYLTEHNIHRIVNPLPNILNGFSSVSSEREGGRRVLRSFWDGLIKDYPPTLEKSDLTLVGFKHNK